LPLDESGGSAGSSTRARAEASGLSVGTRAVGAGSPVAGAQGDPAGGTSSPTPAAQGEPALDGADAGSPTTIGLQGDAATTIVEEIGATAVAQSGSRQGGAGPEPARPLPTTATLATGGTPIDEAVPADPTVQGESAAVSGDAANVGTAQGARSEASPGFSASVPPSARGGSADGNVSPSGRVAADSAPGASVDADGSPSGRVAGDPAQSRSGDGNASSSGRAVADPAQGLPADANASSSGRAAAEPTQGLPMDADGSPSGRPAGNSADADEAAPRPTGQTSATGAQSSAPPPLAAAPAPGIGQRAGRLPHQSASLQRAVESTEAMLRLVARRGATHASLTLRPAQLGAVEVRLRATGDGIVASVSADAAEAATLLQQAEGELRRALEDSGVRLLRLDIAWSRDSQASAGGRDRDAGDQPAGRARPDAAATTDPDSTTGTVVQLANGVLVDVLA
jgi:hypothetical protein